MPGVKGGTHPQNLFKQGQLRVAALLQAMLLDVPADHFRRHLVTHCPSKIAIFPKFPTPQTPLDPWELTKDGPGTQTLEPSDHLRHGGFCRKVAFLRTNVKIVCRKINDLRASA